MRELCRRSQGATPIGHYDRATRASGYVFTLAIMADCSLARVTSCYSLSGSKYGGLQGLREGSWLGHPNLGRYVLTPPARIRSDHRTNSMGDVVR